MGTFSAKSLKSNFSGVIQTQTNTTTQCRVTGAGWAANRPQQSEEEANPPRAAGQVHDEKWTCFSGAWEDEWESGEQIPPIGVLFFPNSTGNQ